MAELTYDERPTIRGWVQVYADGRHIGSVAQVPFSPSQPGWTPACRICGPAGETYVFPDNDGAGKARAGRALAEHATSHREPADDG